MRHVPDSIRADIKALVDYAWDVEAEDYADREDDEKDGHIFERILNINGWFNETERPVDMTPKHTPGPWKVLAETPHPLHQHRYVATSDAKESDVSADGEWHLEDGSLICRMRDTARQAHDARLIALAPELLAFVAGIAGGVKWSESEAGMGTPAQAVERDACDQRIEHARGLVARLEG